MVAYYYQYVFFGIFIVDSFLLIVVYYSIYFVLIRFDMQLNKNFITNNTFVFTNNNI